MKEEDTDYDKDYDAFISFAHEDDEFVIKEIINGKSEKNFLILRKLFYKICLKGQLPF